MYDVQPKDFRWWKHKGDAAGEKAFSLVDRIRESDSARRRNYLKFLLMYGNMPEGIVSNTWLIESNHNRIRMNVIKAVTDTVAAKIGKHRPHPKPVTSGGNYSLRRKAKNLDGFWQAQFDISGVYRVGAKIATDACVFGTGVMKIYRSGKRILTERVYPGELFVDPWEGLYGLPRQMHQMKFIAREVLLEQFPEAKGKIMAAQPPTPGGNDYVFGVNELGYNSEADQLEVFESWHLPSGPDAADGRHMIYLATGAVLFEDDWPYDYFPFVSVNWTDRLRGFWGVGLAEDLSGIQIEINKILQKIQQSFHLFGVPRVLAEEGSSITKATLNNLVGAIISYRGTRPEFSVPQSVHPEVFQHLDRLWQRGFELAGLNTAAPALKSHSLSGKAANMLYDMEYERYVLFARQYADMYITAARIMTDLGKEISAEYPDFAAPARNDRGTVAMIKWSEIHMEEDAYTIQVFPTSALSNEPSMRIQQVQELLGSGLMDINTAKKVLDFPDLDRETRLDRAAADNCDRMIELILDEGEDVVPEPYMDLALLLKTAQAAYNNAENEGVPEERCRKLRNLMRATQQLIKASMAEEQALQIQQGVAANVTPPSPAGNPTPIGTQGAPPTAAQAPSPEVLQ